MKNEKPEMNDDPPGIWKEGNAVHIDIPTLLQHFGCEDTNQNRAALTALLRQAVLTNLPGATVIEKENR